MNKLFWGLSVMLLARCNTAITQDKAESKEVANPITQDLSIGKLNVDSVCSVIDLYCDKVNCSEYDLFGESTEGALVQFFGKDSSMGKLSAHFYGETGARKFMYYVWKGQPIKVMDIEYSYLKPIGSGYLQMDSTITNSNLLDNAGDVTEYLKTYTMLIDSSKSIKLRNCN